MIEFKDNRRIFQRERQHSRPVVIMILLGLVIGGLYVFIGNKRGAIKSLFLPTGVPTRIPRSYALEGETQFTAGNLKGAITAYQQAVQMNPNDADVLAELARTQTYYSELSTTDAQRAEQLANAKANIDKATEIAPDDPFVFTLRAFVYDWNATPSFAAANFNDYIDEAQQAILKATQLDPNNALAMAYQAEIYLDQQKWTQAQESINLALQRDTTQMDIYRVSGLVKEATGDYQSAVDEYLKAAALAPNFTPLYIRIGTNYRTLGAKSSDDATQMAYYGQALDYYARAVSINKQIEVDDPIPYLSIAKTYIQEGEFFIAALNVQTALEMLPDNPDIYAQLAMVYRGARNYESAIPAFQCALEGCDAALSCEVRQCNSETDAPHVIEGLPLSQTTLVYYYTYASVLAGMNGRTHPDYCQKAQPIFTKIHQGFPEDPETLSIIAPSEAICASFNADGTTIQATAAPTMDATEIAAATQSLGSGNPTSGNAGATNEYPNPTLQVTMMEPNQITPTVEPGRP